MSAATTVKKFKWFWYDEDVEQEQWLRSMAQQGLHLKKLNILQQWTFVKGAPADIVYRVDFNHEGMSADYRQLLEDAGWEQAVEFFGWQYWRTPAVDGHAPEIFTDSDSKSAKFKRLLVVVAVTSMPLLYTFTRRDKYPPPLPEYLATPSLVLLSVALLISLVGIVRLGARLLQARGDAG